MVELAALLGKLRPIKVLVAGDLMLDAYTLGRAKRISPEAPVPVVLVEREEELPGGAGNVMLNLRALGAHVAALGRVGSDAAGEKIKRELAIKGVDIRGLYAESGYSTTIKHRVIASNQQMVRFDRETVAEIRELFEEKIVERLPELFEEVDALALSDYGKGFLTPSLIQALIGEARRREIPAIVDPKGCDYSRYQKATVIKPNLKEAYDAAALTERDPLDAVAKKLLEQTDAELLMITRSEMGISLFSPGGKERHYPVAGKEVKDVTGAGDTVLAVTAFALGNGLSDEQAVRLANVAAGLAIEKVGCVAVTLQQLARRLLAERGQRKLFEESHLFALRAALEKRRLKVLGIAAKSSLSSSLLQAIFEISGEGDEDLLVYLQEESPDEELLKLLSSLKEIDFIAVSGKGLHSLFEEIEPEEVYFHDGTSLKRQKDLLSLL